MRTWQKKRCNEQNNSSARAFLNCAHFLSRPMQSNNVKLPQFASSVKRNHDGKLFQFPFGSQRFSFICYAEVEVWYRMRRYTNEAILEFKAEIHLLIEIFLGIAVLTSHYNVKSLTFWVKFPHSPILHYAFSS